jgi:hypothetical protein
MVLAALGWRRALQKWCQIAEHVSTGAVPYGVGLDVVPEGIERLKICFAAQDWNRRYFEDLLDCLDLRQRFDSLVRLISLCEQDQPWLRPWGIMPTVEFLDRPEGALELKVEISCNHLRTSDVQMDARIMRYLHELCMDPEEYRSVLGLVSNGPLSDKKVERIQYCAIGFSHRDAVRFNVYLCPDLGPPESSRPAS